MVKIRMGCFFFVVALLLPSCLQKQMEFVPVESTTITKLPENLSIQYLPSLPSPKIIPRPSDPVPLPEPAPLPRLLKPPVLWGDGSAPSFRPAVRPEFSANDFQDIFFDYASSKIGLRKDKLFVEKALAINIVIMERNPGIEIILEGHTDRRGSKKYNLKLGMKRAEAVKNYMVSAGIDPKRIQVVSYGKERPFVLGNEGVVYKEEVVYRWNRRVHITVIKQ